MTPMPPQQLTRTISTFCAVASIALGISVMIGWLFGIDALVTVLPNLISMKFNTAFGFVLGGLSLALFTLATPGARRLGILVTFALLALALATLIERVTLVNLGIDQLLMHDPVALPHQPPGRMALATALAFALSAGCLILSRTAAASQRRSTAARALAYTVTAIGGLGLLGYLLDVDIFFALPGFGTIALHTAVGFIVLGGGMIAAGYTLWAGPGQTPDARLAALATRILVVTIGITSVVSFAIMTRETRHTLANGLTYAEEGRISQITSNFALRTTRAKIISSRPNLLTQLRRLQTQPQDNEASATALAELQSFIQHGFTYIVLFDVKGREQMHVGTPGTRPLLQAELQASEPSWLLWRADGYYLRKRIALTDAQGLLGYVLSEQPMPNLTGLTFSKMPWTSGEFRLCVPDTQRIACFPGLLHRAPTSEPRHAVSAESLVQRAVRTGSGVFVHAERGGQRRLGVISSTGTLGLVAVLGVDTADIYRPLAAEFLSVLALAGVLAANGFWLLRRQLRPMAARLVDAEALARSHYEVLQANTALLRSVFADSPDAILVVDGAGLIVEANPRAKTLFGYPHSSLLGQPVEMLLPERYRAVHPDHRAHYATAPRTRAMGSQFALSARRSDGEEFPVDVVLSPIQDTAEARTIAIVRDITERRVAEDQITAALAEKTVLLQEVHHRVKNNLQVISSLLDLQAGNTDDPTTQTALADAQGRVKSMALLHQMLYEQKNFASINLDEYLRQLTQHALGSANASQVEIELALEPLSVDLKQAVPCALLVNELLSNVCKHAFPGLRAGILRLELHAPDADGLALIAISDNGVGLPETIQPGQTRSLGFQIIPLLAEQIGATLNIVRGNGTRFELRFRPLG
jgi:PAS domain S-box-containing protein